MPSRGSKQRERPPIVLLVEDHLDTSEMYAMFLEHEGFIVISAYDGEDAIGKAKAQRPSAVVTDLSLPSMDGRELGRRLRAAEKTRDVPLILLTGHALADDTEPFDVVLLKPCLPDALARVISEVIGRSTEAGRHRP